MTNFFLQNLWRWKIGVKENSLIDFGKAPTLQKLEADQWIKEFEKLRKNRMVLGAFRYGSLRSNKKKKRDLIKNMIDRLELYKDSGNLEHLLDVANIAMIEFYFAKSEGKEVEPIDDGIHANYE